jgi:serine/threonine-protein kinase
MLGAVVVAAAVIVGVVGAAAYMQASIPSHVVPATLVNAQYDDALHILEPFGWDVEVERVRVDGTVAGQVLESDPAAGEKLKEGKTLKLKVSEGPTLVLPPEGLVGKTQDQAAALLAAVELGVEFVGEERDDVPEGTVTGFADNPVPADGFPKGSTVRLLVAADENPDIPDLVGVPFQDAVDQLESLGLTAEVEGRRPRDGQEPGTVVSTDPQAGTEVDQGSTVKVVVAVDSVEVPDVSRMSLDEARATLEEAGLSVGWVVGSDEGNVLYTAPGAGSEVDLDTEVTLVMGGRGRGRD